MSEEGEVQGERAKEEKESVKKREREKGTRAASVDASRFHFTAE